LLVWWFGVDDKTRIQIVAVFDIIVSILIIITGIFVISFGMGWGDFIEMVTGYSYYSSNPYAFTEPTPMIFIMIGITTLLYGIKRMIDNILRIVVRLNPTNPQPQFSQQSVPNQNIPQQQIPQQQMQPQDYRDPNKENFEDFQ